MYLPTSHPFFIIDIYTISKLAAFFLLFSTVRGLPNKKNHVQVESDSNAREINFNFFPFLKMQIVCKLSVPPTSKKTDGNIK
jgi:hypothetical protein